MIRLVSKDLKIESSDYLQKLQKKVDDEVAFSEKVDKAQSLWGSKSGSAKGKKVFSEIVETLAEMCVSVEVCNYCEQNEANDIEHIAPKSFFPERAFQWENYLLACKQCNTAYKLDKCAVLDENDELIPCIREAEPTFKEYAFINPRIESPSAFLIVNMSSFIFEILPDLTRKDFNKACQTLDIIKLNERETLIHSRKESAKYLFQRLCMLVEILSADSVSEIEQILTLYENEFDNTLPLSEIKAHLKESFKKDIQIHQHPSVWHAIKIIESKTNEKWKVLFLKIPEALTGKMNLIKQKALVKRHNPPTFISFLRGLNFPKKWLFVCYRSAIIY